MQERSRKPDEKSIVERLNPDLPESLRQEIGNTQPFKAGPHSSPGEPKPISNLPIRQEPAPFEQALEQRKPDPNCRHHWIIESPKGPISRGTCRNCSGTRDFRNTLEDPFQKPYHKSPR